MLKQSKFFGLLLLLLIGLAACSTDTNNRQDLNRTGTLTISAASSLKDAMDVIQDAYREKNPNVTLKFNFGSSGSLQRQISQGAPVNLFISANEDKFELLVSEGLIAKEDRVNLLGNSLVLIVPKEDQTINNFEELKKVDGKISIGTPETVPAGYYAREVLEQMDLWKDVESKIVYAKDVRQVLSYVETGNVRAGIVYKTDALSSDKVDIVEIANPSAHSPIVYSAGVIMQSKQYDAAKEFYDFLQSENTLKVFENYGFTTQQ